MSDLQEMQQLPAGFLEARPEELQALLGRPTLIHLPGEQPEPLFVSTLLHGNETTGFTAVQQLLRAYAETPLPRALSIFVGNVVAAASSERALPGQPDFNRIWPDAAGRVPAGTPPDVARMARQVIETMRARSVFAALDLHNTSGRNPPHACVNAMRADCLALASVYAQRVLFFTRPVGVLCMAFTPWCPAVTVECGPVGTEEGLQLLGNYLDYCLHLKALDNAVLDSAQTQIYRSVARVELVPAVSVQIGESGADLNLQAGIDGYNWRELAAGTLLGRVSGELGQVLRVSNPDGVEVAGHYLQQRGEDILTRRLLTPAMLTTDPDIIRQDCLCYFLERVC